MIQEIKKTVAFIQMASGMVLFACLPMFFNGLTRVAMILFITFSLLDYFLQKGYQKASFFSIQKIPFWASIVYFLLLIMYIPFEENTQHTSLFIESRSSFLVFGILGVLGTRVPKSKHMAYTCIIAAIGLITYTLFLAYTKATENITDWIRYIHLVRHTNIHAHMAFNMYLNIAIAACFWLIKTQKEKRTRFLWIIPIIIFYIAIATSDGRIGILACNLLIAIGIIYLLGEKYKKITLGTLIIFGALGCFILFNNQKIKKQLESNHDTRYDIWTESFSLFLDHPWLGVGVSTNISNITDVFIASEVIKKDEFLIQSCLHQDVMGAHPHNQLLQSSMEFGLLGLVCMGCMLFLPFVYCIKQRSDLMITSCWILILIQMQTEVIRGSYGDLAFGIYMLLAMNYAQQSSKKVVGSMQGHDQLPSAT